MKKVSLLVLVCMILSLAFVSCDMITPHEHSFGTEWLNDGKNHFNACSGCSEKGSLEAHIDSNGDNACDICNFPIENLYSVHEHEYNTAWAFDAVNHFHTCKTCGGVTASAAHADANGDNACDVCSFTMKNLFETHTHDHNTDWSFDTTNHFHSCKTCVDVTDVAAHTDADGDNDCDVCGYVIENLYAEHQHSFGNAWLFDNENHFHRCDTCTEVTGTEPHTDADGDNLCDICGCIVENLYVAPTPIGTVGAVLESAFEKDGLVNGSSIYYSYSDGLALLKTISVEKSLGADFADYIIIENTQGLYGSYTETTSKTYSLVDGDVVAFAMSEYGIEKLHDQDSGWLYGYGFDKIYGSSGDVIYGISAVLENLYDRGIENQTIVESVVTVENVTTYGFTLSHTSYDSICDISVSFTLGEQGNIATVDIETVYTYVDGETGEALYGIPAYIYNYTVAQTAGDLDTEPEYSANDYLLQSVVLTDAEGNVLNADNGITIDAASETVIYITNITPETAVVDIQTQVLDEDGNETYLAYASFDSYNNAINVGSYQPGDFTIVVKINGDDNNSITVPFTATVPETTQIGVKVNGSEYPMTEASVFLGNTLTLEGAAGACQDASISATLTGDNVADATLTLNDDGTYSFTSNVLGTYTVEIKSLANADLEAVVLTITVKEAPNYADLITKTHKFVLVDDYEPEYGESYTLTFTATNETSGTGNVYYTSNWFYGGDEYSTDFTYTLVDGVFTVVFEDGYFYDLTLNDDGYFVVWFSYEWPQSQYLDIVE